jgi:hypothetical protein
MNAGLARCAARVRVYGDIIKRHEVSFLGRDFASRIVVWPGVAIQINLRIRVNFAGHGKEKRFPLNPVPQALSIFGRPKSSEDDTIRPHMALNAKKGLGSMGTAPVRRRGDMKNAN